MTKLLQSDLQNHLLSSMSSDDFALIEPHLLAVHLGAYDVLIEADAPIEFVHFIEQGVASLVMTDERGISLGIAMIGREGMSGIAVLHGLDRSSHQTFVQVAGSALRLRADILRAAMNESPTLRALLMRFAYGTFTQVSLSALAHGRYKIAPRLARWLLLCHDRLDRDDLPLTHHLLSLMVGAHRPAVTTSLHELAAEGCIKVGRQVIHVRDRDKLIEIAGGCYSALDQQHVGLGLRQRRGDLRPEQLTA